MFNFSWSLHGLKIEAKAPGGKNTILFRLFDFLTTNIFNLTSNTCWQRKDTLASSLYNSQFKQKQ